MFSVPAWDCADPGKAEVVDVDPEDEVTTPWITGRELSGVVSASFSAVLELICSTAFNHFAVTKDASSRVTIPLGFKPSVGFLKDI